MSAACDARASSSCTTSTTPACSSSTARGRRSSVTTTSCRCIRTATTCCTGSSTATSSCRATAPVAPHPIIALERLRAKLDRHRGAAVNEHERPGRRRRPRSPRRWRDSSRDTGTDPPSPIGVHAVNWRTLPDDEARAEWDALRAWVEWFTVRYRHPRSASCRTAGGSTAQLVEELSALHIAHLAAFDSSDAGFGPIGWHERSRLAHARALTRVRRQAARSGHDDTQTPLVGRTRSTSRNGTRGPTRPTPTEAPHGCLPNGRKKDDDQNPGHHRGQPHR